MKPNTQLRTYLRLLRHEYLGSYPSPKEREMIAEMLRANGVKELRCLCCGAKLTLSNLRYWGPHENGINGKWYYLHCPNCGYDTSIVKVLRLGSRR